MFAFQVTIFNQEFSSNYSLKETTLKILTKNLLTVMDNYQRINSIYERERKKS